MWPFGKKVDSCCMSGFATCDGKHHTMTSWRDVIVERTVCTPWMQKPETFASNAQERTCVVCNYRERRAVDETN